MYRRIYIKILKFQNGVLGVKEILKTHMVRNQACVLLVALLGLKPSSNDSLQCVHMAIQRDYTVGVWKHMDLWWKHFDMGAIFLFVS